MIIIILTAKTKQREIVQKKQGRGKKNKTKNEIINNTSKPNVVQKSKSNGRIVLFL